MSALAVSAIALHPIDDNFVPPDPGNHLVTVALGYATVHTLRAVVPEDRLGVAHEDVAFTTSDGLELEGWYIPSRNGAAVISLPGRNGPQRQARMLARHGYGVLLFDRRGEGRAQLLGPGRRRGRQGRDRLPAAPAGRGTGPHRRIGLSVGGEMMLETAAETDDLTAVVSEGAGSRTVSEDVEREDGAGVDKVLGPILSGVRTASISPRPVMFIAAPNSPHGEDLNRVYHRAAGQPKSLWEIPESGHTGGIEARPHEYERRVVGFFDEALGS